MQIQQSCLKYVFSCISKKNQICIQYKDSLIFSQIILGSLFIRGYRIFTKHDNYQCCIFYKRNNFKTDYLYLKFAQKYINGTSNKSLEQVTNTIKQIDDLKGYQQVQFKVVFCYLLDYCTIQLNKNDYEVFSGENLGNIQFKPVFYNKAVTNDEQNLIVVGGKEELLKLKEVVWTYINTFGNKYKNNYYRDTQKTNSTTFNLEKLINTVNWIIYYQTLDKPFNAIETANWTCFQMRAKEKLKPDRKDILLSGSGRTMMIHLLLLQNLNNYIKQYQNEVGEVIFQFKKSYLEGEVKAYQISDQLEQNNLIYRMKSSTIQKYSI